MIGTVQGPFPALVEPCRIVSCKITGRVGRLIGGGCALRPWYSNRAVLLAVIYRIIVIILITFRDGRRLLTEVVRAPEHNLSLPTLTASTSMHFRSG